MKTEPGKKDKKWRYESWDESIATDSELYNKLADKDPGRYSEIISSRYDGTPTPKGYPRKEFASIEQMESLKKRLDNARAFTTPPKKKVVSLAKPQKPLPFSLDKWLDEIDPQWWILPDEVTPDEEAKNRLILKKKMKVAEGIESLMRLHRRLT